MPRPTVYLDHHFFKEIPDNEGEAITAQELRARVGCSRSLVGKWVQRHKETGMIKLGNPTTMGAETFYKVSVRPDNWMPKMLDSGGKYIPFNVMIKLILSLPVGEVQGKLNAPIIKVVLTLWNAANSDGDDFIQINQQQRAALQQYRIKVAALLKTIDSILQDDFLGGDKADVEMAQDAMRSLGREINLEDVVKYRNAL